MTDVHPGGERLWTPTDADRRASTMHAFLERASVVAGRPFPDYDAAWRWSVDEPEAFWPLVAAWFRIPFATPPTRVLADPAMPGARWFDDATLNYAEAVFARATGDRPALLAAAEGRPVREVSWDALRRDVAALAAGLRRLGVRPGDRVAAIVPNIPEAVVGLLATASIGAIWSSCAPEFGARSIIDRLRQIEPAVLIAVDGYRFGGRVVDRREVIEAVRAELPGLRAAVLIRTMSGSDSLEGEAWSSWDSVLADVDDPPGPAFEPVPFDHPLWILFSSGTTGLPKAIVHGQGGILLEQLKKSHLHLDAHEDDRVFWFSTTGWMMWNFLVGALLTDASIVLYDGNPAGDVLWQLAADAHITIFGGGAAYFAGQMKEGAQPTAGRDLSSIHAVGSTGSPLSPEAFAWIYEQLGSDTWLFSTSGGTDVCTAFVGGVPTLPVHLGELQAPSLGCDVQAWDEEGEQVIGEVGELVITKPMPSMPVSFWNDPDGSRYRESYFEMFPGVWRHGDWIELTERRTAIIYGRSDSTINRGGVRMGTSEIYRAVLADDDVVDALVVDVPREGEENWMPLFVVLRDGVELDDELVKRIKARVRTDCSPRHVPNDVHQVAEIPRTLSGKVLEVPVKRILMGTPPDQAASRDSLANPAALDPFVALADG